MDEIIQCLQWRYFTAGGYIDIRPKCTDPFMGVVFRVCVDGNMALIQVHGGACRKRTGRFIEVFSGDFNDRTFRYQDGDTCSLGDIILLGHIQNMSPDDVRHMCQYAR